MTNDDSVSLRRVSIGEDLDEQIIILSGVTAGERIAINPIAAGIALKQAAGNE